MKKRIIAILGVMALLAGCGNAAGPDDSANLNARVTNSGQNAESQNESSNSEGDHNTGEGEENMYSSITIDENKTYQTIESFGTSGCWWSQYVGGFTKTPYDDGVESRDAIATLLFDREKGIGLTCYRFNLGAGSVEANNGNFTDVHRRAQNFLDENGNYDFTKDANAVWFLHKAVELGVDEVVLFCNSPLVTLTDNGMAHMTEGGSRTNLSPEKYPEFAKYCMDVAEHFVEEGVPVKFISPINEPQWDWYGSQEGCHYAPEEIPGVYLAFLDELEKRPALSGVKLSGPESGEWKGQAKSYTSALLNNERLSEHFDTIDNHSYWSSSMDKMTFKTWMDMKYPEVKLRTSEWCEMVNGSDVTMDSAYHIAQEIANDLRILDVVSWQNWVGVAPGGYRDGLIYIDEKTQKFRALKRLYSFGNYSRYVRPGYTRVDLQTSGKSQEEMLPVAFAGRNDQGKEELVMVFINESMKDETFVLEGIQGYNNIKTYVTSDDLDLECVLDENFTESDPVTISKRTVTTVVFTKE